MATHLWYYTPLLSQWDGTTVVDINTDTLKAAITSSSYSVNQDTHDFFNDVTNEVSGTNYSAGGATLASVTATRSTTTVTWDAADVTISQHASGFSTGRKVVIYKSTGTASTSPLLTVFTADADFGNVAGDLTIQWNASGISTWSTT